MAFTRCACICRLSCGKQRFPWFSLVATVPVVTSSPTLRVECHNMQKGCERIVDNNRVGAMRAGRDLVYGLSKCYRQRRPAHRADPVPGEGDAAGTVLVPRSEMDCRLHRPYEEEELAYCITFCHSYPFSERRVLRDAERRGRGIYAERRYQGPGGLA
jgi:hypothetical protein